MGFQSPQLCSSLHRREETHHVLAEAVAHEEHSVFGNVGDKGRRGALVQAPQPHLLVDGGEAVQEASVHARERLHLHLGCVERLPAEHTGSATWDREGGGHSGAGQVGEGEGKREREKKGDQLTEARGRDNKVARENEHRREILKSSGWMAMNRDIIQYSESCSLTSHNLAGHSIWLAITLLPG